MKPFEHIATVKASVAKKYGIFILLILYFACGLFTIFYFDGTADAGDSVMHYLFARYAPQHPELFFDHWAKPVFVLLNSPFAQFGMKGIKLFNLLVMGGAAYLTFVAARVVKMKNVLIAPLLLILSPYAYAQTFSGLTEPLFAFFLICGIVLVIKQKPVAAAIVISFLPFVRSEGLVILVIFCLYFLLNKQWKVIGFLLCGHMVYSVAGSFVHHDLLWIFTKIPYARLSSAYGSGSATHFITQLLYVVGVPAYVLFLAGLLAFITGWIRKTEKFVSVNTILILGCTLSYIVAHSLFWSLGIFNSMGLKRVLIGILPLIAITGLYGYNFITEHKFIRQGLKTAVQAVIIAYTCIFPFTGNPAAINIEKDLSLSKDQLCAKEVTEYIITHCTPHGRMFYDYHYFSETFGIDHFDKSKHRELKTENRAMMHKGDLIIWDDWFALYTAGITTPYIENIPGIEKIKEFSYNDRGTAGFIIYRLN